jgi:hypothetical protein
MRPVAIAAIAVALGSFRPHEARADEAASSDWKDRTHGNALMLGGGGEALAFWFLPSAGDVYVEGALNVRLAKAVDFRATQRLGFGVGLADGGAFFTCLPALILSFRFHPAPYYTIWLGYEGRVGIAAHVSGSDDVGVLPLHGPDLSLASFRFGRRGEFELDHDGGIFVAPIWGYHGGFTLRYSFEE